MKRYLDAFEVWFKTHDASEEDLEAMLKAEMNQLDQMFHRVTANLPLPKATSIESLPLPDSNVSMALSSNEQVSEVVVDPVDDAKLPTYGKKPKMAPSTDVPNLRKEEVRKSLAHR